MNHLSKEDFRKQAIKALMSIIGKAYEENYYRRIRSNIEFNMAWADFNENNTRFSINITGDIIRIRMTNWHDIDKHEVYYTYNENDDHYDVIKKFKNDSIKNIRQCKKIGTHDANYKIYLYNGELKNYENKYYTPGGKNNEDN